MNDTIQGMMIGFAATLGVIFLVAAVNGSKETINDAGVTLLLGCGAALVCLLVSVLS